MTHLNTGCPPHPRGGVFSVAGISVALDAALCPPFPDWPSSYWAFLGAASGAVPDVSCVVGADHLCPEDAHFVPTYTAGSWQAGQFGPRRVYRFHGSANQAYLWAEADADFRCIAVWPVPGSARVLAPLLHPVDRLLFIGILSRRRGCIIHSCGWSRGGTSLLFPGVSGAGKTTLCRQLMASGEGRILSDDRVVIRAGGDGFTAHGTPWPGDAKQALNEFAPLAGIAFIEQSPQHQVIPIRPDEALQRLFATASIPWYDAELRDRMLPIMERLVETVPAYRLGFHPQPDVVEHLLPLLAADAAPQNIN